MDNVARGEKARRIAHSYVGWAVGAGFIPFPLVDVGSLVVLQVKMLTEIARVYEVPLERERARTLVMSTAGGLAPQGVALIGIPALLKFVPVVGTLLGIAVMPAAAATSTLALAEIFIRHVETYGKVPDPSQITQCRAELPTATEVVVDEPAVSETTSRTERVPGTPTVDSAVSTPLSAAEVAVAEPATTETAAVAEPDASMPSDGHPAAARKPRAGSGSEEANEDAVPPTDADPPPDADTEQTVRRRNPSSRPRRRAPPTETS